MKSLYKRVNADETSTFMRTEIDCRAKRMREVGTSDEAPEKIVARPTKRFELIQGASKSNLFNFVQ